MRAAGGSVKSRACVDGDGLERGVELGVEVAVDPHVHAVVTHAMVAEVAPEEEHVPGLQPEDSPGTFGENAQPRVRHERDDHRQRHVLVAKRHHLVRVLVRVLALVTHLPVLVGLVVALRGKRHDGAHATERLGAVGGSQDSLGREGGSEACAQLLIPERV